MRRARLRHCFVARIWKLLLLPNMRRILAIVIVGSSMLGADAQAQSAVRAHQYTTQEHTQTSDATPVGTGEYRFVLDGPVTSRDTVSFGLPGGGQSLGVNRVYANMDALHAQYPAGTYTANLEHRTLPFDPPTRHTLQGDFPENPSYPTEVPHITNSGWENGALVVAPNFTLTFEGWEGRPNDSMIRLHLLGPSANYTRTAYGLDMTSVTFGGPGNYQLSPNSTYNAVLTFMDPFNTVSTAIPGSFPQEFQFSQGGGNAVRFTIVTVPEPSTWAILGAGMLCFGLQRRKKTKN